jgi:hypothetical protein
VVAHQAERADGADEVDTLEGLGAIAHDVTQADDPVKALGADVGQDGAEGFGVPVNVAWTAARKSPVDNRGRAQIAPITRMSALEGSTIAVGNSRTAIQIATMTIKGAKPSAEASP